MLMPGRIATGERLRVFDASANLTKVGISPDGRFVTALAGKRAPLVWEPATGRVIGALDGQEGSVAGLRFGHDSRSIATVDEGKNLRVFDL